MIITDYLGHHLPVAHSIYHILNHGCVIPAEQISPDSFSCLSVFLCTCKAIIYKIICSNNIREQTVIYHT